MADLPLNEQMQSERRVVVYMPNALWEAMERQARASNGEGYSVSKIIRSACREYLRRRSSR